MDTYLKTNYVLQYGCWCLQSYGKTDMQLNPHEIFKEISIFFSLVIAHSFIVHMGILHRLQIGKELLYTQDSGQSNPANISVLIGFFFFFFFKVDILLWLMQRVKKENKNYSYYLKDEIHLVICKYSTGRSYNEYLMEL